MRKIIVFNLVTLDGLFAGEDGDIDWHHVDEEFNDFALEQTSTFGAIIFGKTTYQIFEDFWPKALKDPTMSPEDHKIAQIIDDVEKIVISKTLKTVSWKNTKLFSEINGEEVMKWKQQAGNDMFILGSGTIVREMAEKGLIDEYRLLINPLILGRGKPMFDNLKNKIPLKLLNTRDFKNGNVLLTYEVIK